MSAAEGGIPLPTARSRRAAAPAAPSRSWASCSSPRASSSCSLWPGSCGGPTWNPMPGSATSSSEFARDLETGRCPRAASSPPTYGPPTSPEPGRGRDDRHPVCSAFRRGLHPAHRPGNHSGRAGHPGHRALSGHGHARGCGKLRRGRPPADPRRRPGQHRRPGARGQDLRPDPRRLLRLRVPEQPDRAPLADGCAAAGADAARRQHPRKATSR